ncbi:MAG: ferrous iron transport protein B [Gemmatales bacterium]
MTAPPAASLRTITVALVGNPNTGKTTLFNALSGMHQKVGNYPGVTVEKKVGTFKVNQTIIHLIDLPGTYSLAARSPDELVTVDLLLGQQPGEPRPDVILNIVDASNLERHSFLTSQLTDLGIPILVAANMMDMAEAQGVKLDARKYEQTMGLPLFPIEAHRAVGLEPLREALCQVALRVPTPLSFPSAFEAEVTAVQQALQTIQATPAETHPALVKRLLIDRQGAIEQRYLEKHPGLSATLVESRKRLDEARCAVPQIEARTRYGMLRESLASAVQHTGKTTQKRDSWIDRIVTHRVWGLLLFLAILFVIFQSIFVGAEPAKQLLDAGIKTLGTWCTNWLSSGPLKSLIQDGVFAGVGGVITFLPQILILFAFLCVLEDCGYMARAAFLMDKIMSRCGLSGKSFIPLLSSFACAIPGVMATRVIEDRRDRLATMLVAPLMSCSARLPVYALLIGAFVPTNTMLGGWLPGLVLFGLYLIGIVVAPLVAWGLKRTMLRGETPLFVLELPPYRWPSWQSVLFRMVERAWAFIRRAGTFILASMIVVWALLYFPRADEQGQLYPDKLEALETRKEEASKAGRKEEAGKLDDEMKHTLGAWKRHSLLGRAGQFLEPAFKPLGWDWRIGTAALAAFPAREVMVGTLGILFDVGEDNEDDTTLRERLQEATWTDQPEKKLFTLASALSVMVFFALCCQCASTLAVIARESNSWRWPLFAFAYMTVLAYIAAWGTYQMAAWCGGAN